MYLEHFGLKTLPFSLTPNTAFYCDLPEHKNALNVILFGLRSGEGFIKVVGEVGSGKTLLCRKVLNLLDTNCVVAYIPNPDLSPDGLRRLIAKELSILLSPTDTPADVLDKLYAKLIELKMQEKRTVLLIDEAQTMPDASLEALRLLSNLETESEKLLQMVLFAQPELDGRLMLPKLRQLRQRITFSYKLTGLQRTEVSEYIHYRLQTAGYGYPSMFDQRLVDLIHKHSQGIPRLINIICHKALLSAYGRGDVLLDKQDVMAAVKDNLINEPVSRTSVLSPNPYVIIFSSFVILVLLMIIGAELMGWLRW